MSAYAKAGNLPSLPLGALCCGGGGGISSLVFSAIILWKAIPTPSITASRIAHPIAPFRIALGPPLTAKAPPVKPPAMIAFHGSSFFRTPFTAQSNDENMPPQTPKLPPNTGARAFIAVRAMHYYQYRGRTFHRYRLIAYLLSVARHKDYFGSLSRHAILLLLSPVI